MGAFRISVSPGVERAGLVGAVVAAAAAAWAALWLGDPSHGALHFHGPANPGGIAALTGMLVFVAAWTVMSVAMMLPTSLPVLTVLHTFARERADRWVLIALAASGYLAAWVAVGAIVGPFSLGLHTLTALPGTTSQAERAVMPALLLVAGLFQFSSLKYRCLEKCRSPLNFVLSHWRGQQQRWQAFRLGWASGVFCVGCCWALMLLMLLSSVQHLVLMLVLGLAMALEKNVRWGRRLSAPLGIVLMIGAVVVFLNGGDLGPLSRAMPEFCGTK